MTRGALSVGNRASEGSLAKGCQSMEFEVEFEKESRRVVAANHSQELAESRQYLESARGSGSRRRRIHDALDGRMHVPTDGY